VKKSIHLHKRQKRHAFMITSFSVLILILLTISPAAAAVSSWELSPEKPVVGDTLRIKGSASPEEEIEVKVTFEKKVSVSGGEYEYILEGVKIPEGFDNRFTVQATGARDLNVRVKILIWITKSSEASGNTATVTQSNVPPGTYQIKMDGNAKSGTSTVNLKITAVQQIKADLDGDFSYSYNTKAVPAGDFEIIVGGITKKATLQEKETSAMTSDYSSEETEPETESITEQTPSETPEETDDIEKTVIVSSPEQTPEEVTGGEAQEPEPVEKAGLPVDTTYILGGMGAAFLILAIYFKRNEKK